MSERYTERWAPTREPPSMRGNEPDSVTRLLVVPDGNTLSDPLVCPQTGLALASQQLLHNPLVVILRQWDDPHTVQGQSRGGTFRNSLVPPNNEILQQYQRYGEVPGHEVIPESEFWRRWAHLMYPITPETMENPLEPIGIVAVASLGIATLVLKKQGYDGRDYYVLQTRDILLNRATHAFLTELADSYGVSISFEFFAAQYLAHLNKLTNENYDIDIRPTRLPFSGAARGVLDGMGTAWTYYRTITSPNSVDPYAHRHTVMLNGPK